MNRKNFLAVPGSCDVCIGGECGWQSQLCKLMEYLPALRVEGKNLG